MNTEDEKDPIRKTCGWVYRKLPDTVRPATEKDLFMPSGRLNVGKDFLFYGPYFKVYYADKIRQSTTEEEIRRMLKDNVIFVKK
jgi:hypothetical protein